MSYSVVIAADFGAANTGLTVYGKLFDTDGVQVGSTITTGFVEAVAGLYVYVLSAPDSHNGVFVAYDSANTALRRVAVVAPRETENSDVKTSTRGTSTLTTSDIPGATVIADAVLGRSVAYVEDTAGIYSIAGLILAAFESSAPGTTWTIKKTDGATTFATRTLTEDINAKPVTGVS